MRVHPTVLLIRNYCNFIWIYNRANPGSGYIFSSSNYVRARYCYRQPFRPSVCPSHL